MHVTLNSLTRILDWDTNQPHGIIPVEPTSVEKVHSVRRTEYNSTQQPTK